MVLSIGGYFSSSAIWKRKWVASAENRGHENSDFTETGELILVLWKYLYSMDLCKHILVPWSILCSLFTMYYQMSCVFSLLATGFGGKLSSVVFKCKLSAMIKQAKLKFCLCWDFWNRLSNSTTNLKWCSFLANAQQIFRGLPMVCWTANF